MVGHGGLPVPRRRPRRVRVRALSLGRYVPAASSDARFERMRPLV
jgi:hypothetical protein